MPTISGSIPPQGNNVYSKPPIDSLQTEKNQKKITIEITPGENNVSSGDRSANTAKINITSPNSELETEVSREQAFNAVERRTYKKIAQQAIGGNPSGSLIKTGIVAQSGLIESENIEELAALRLQKNKIETYSQATQNNPYVKTDTSQNTNLSQEPSPLQQYNEAKNAYMKQQFIFSTADRLDISEDV